MRYIFKEKFYKILYESKIKLGGIWIDAIIYECQYENPDGMVWVRTKEEFFRLFSEVIEPHTDAAAKMVDQINSDPKLWEAAKTLAELSGKSVDDERTIGSLLTPRKYSVFMEGFMIQGMDSAAKASFIGTVEATSFADACEKALQKEGHDMTLFNKERLTYWGCKLYDNMDDASKFD